MDVKDVVKLLTPALMLENTDLTLTYAVTLHLSENINCHLNAQTTH